MTIKEQITSVRTMRAQLDGVRDVAPPDEWAKYDARLRELEDNLAEVVALTRYAVEKFEKPALWDDL